MSNLALKSSDPTPQHTVLQATPDIEGAYYTLAVLIPSWMCWMYWVWQDLPHFTLLAINSLVLVYFVASAIVRRKAASMKIHLEDNHLIVFTPSNNRFIPFDKIEKVSLFNLSLSAFYKLEIAGERPEYLPVCFKGSSQVFDAITKYEHQSRQ